MEKKIQCKNVCATSHTAQNLSRYELINWINETLGKNIKNVESLCSGAVYCQFMSLLFPGCINMKKIKLDATLQHEFSSNLKLLQIAFRKVGCEQDVPIERLIKGRFQENFEFLQWFKRFYDVNAESVFIVTGELHAGQPTEEEVLRGQLRPSLAELAEALPTFKHRSQMQPKKIGAQFQSRSLGASASSNLTQARQKQLEKENNLLAEIEELKLRALQVERERDFYFTKLRNIEVMCTTSAADSDDANASNVEIDKETMIANILAELQAAEEEDEPKAEDYDDDETY